MAFALLDQIPAIPTLHRDLGVVPERPRRLLRRRIARDGYIQAMPPTEAQQRTWMRQGRSAAVALERIRRGEFRHADLARIAADVEGACLASLKSDGRAPPSGLAIQQRNLHRMHGR